MPKKPAHQEMNWRFLLFRGSYTYKKGLIVQSSSKTTQLLDPLFRILKPEIKCIPMKDKKYYWYYNYLWSFLL